MKKLKQFDKTTIFKLKPGDRFYFLSDSKKTPWQVEGIMTLKLAIVDKKSQVSISSGSKNRIINKDKQVVFLRNTYEQ